VLGVDPNMPLPDVPPKVLPPFALPNRLPPDVDDDAGAPNIPLPDGADCREDPKRPVDGACDVAEGKGLADCCGAGC
jgi:hypothetical protein